MKNKISSTILVSQRDVKNDALKYLRKLEESMSSLKMEKKLRARFHYVKKLMESLVYLANGKGEK
jgi:hypothetical protein